MNDFDVVPIPTINEDTKRVLQRDVRTATSVAITALRAELVSARAKFPGNRHNLAALTEEVGELNQAMIEYHRGNPDVSADDIFKEAIQVACVALRVATEGDADFKYSR